MGPTVHGRSPSIPGPYYPTPVYPSHPPYFQPFGPYPLGDQPRPGLPALPFRPDGGRKPSWTEHFDFLQTQVKKRRRMHKDADKAQECKKPVYNHPCPLCDRHFPRRNSLAIHLKWHYKDRNGTCMLPACVAFAGELVALNLRRAI